jgi:N-acetylmuramate 1-kinase
MMTPPQYAQPAAVRPVPSKGLGVFYFRRYNATMEKIIRTLAELEVEAARFARALAPRERGATLVTLSGELGAGKTAFAKAVAGALGVEEVVTSPTFVLEKIYLLPLGGHASKFERLVHIDAYRLSRGSDLAPLGFDELMRDAGNLILFEWPERVMDALPAPSTRISLVALDETGGARKISYA